MPRCAAWLSEFPQRGSSATFGGRIETLKDVNGGPMRTSVGAGALKAEASERIAA
jgi:hypothetical protein